MQQSQSACRNRIIQALTPDDFGALAPHLELVRLRLGTSLESADQRIADVFFPEDCLLSVVGRSQNGRTIDTGMIGFEGMTGLAVILGTFSSTQDTPLRSPGAAFRVEATTLSALLDQRPEMRRMMLAFANAMMNQTAQTALANGLATIDMRLARWLLMAADRVGGTDMTFTHEVMATSLGVRRPGVTDALHRLEGERLIRSRRAVVSIRDWAGLEALAGGF